MDTALELKIKYNNKVIDNYKDAEKYLSESELLNALLADFEFNGLNLIWRLTQLAEIPFSAHHDKVKKWLDILVDKTFTGDVFSINGTNDYLLACYNGMITSILIKLNYNNQAKIKQGVDWILKYQNVERRQSCSWTGAGLKKYGGCMKSTPCYIGLVKSMIALSDYKYSNNYLPDDALEIKLKDGLEYILNQNVFQRLSDNKPITTEITKLTYPFTWKTNIIEILRLIKRNNKLDDSRCQPAKDFLISKRKKDGFWWAQSSNIIKNKAWVRFDQSREKGEWISNEIGRLLYV